MLAMSSQQQFSYYMQTVERYVDFLDVTLLPELRVQKVMQALSFNRAMTIAEKSHYQHITRKSAKQLAVILWPILETLPLSGHTLHVLSPACGFAIEIVALLAYCQIKKITLNYRGFDYDENMIKTAEIFRDHIHKKSERPQTITFSCCSLDDFDMAQNFYDLLLLRQPLMQSSLPDQIRSPFVRFIDDLFVNGHNYSNMIVMTFQDGHQIHESNLLLGGWVGYYVKKPTAPYDCCIVANKPMPVNTTIFVAGLPPLGYAKAVLGCCIVACCSLLYWFGCFGQ